MKITGYSEASYDVSKNSVESTDAFKQHLEKAASEKDLEGLKEACESFESFFIQKIFKQMRQTIGSEDKSQARAMFEDMLDEEYSKLIAKADGIGLAKTMYDSMKKAYASNEEDQHFDIKG